MERALVVLILLLASPAWAQSQDDQRGFTLVGGLQYKLGSEAYKAGNYARAVEWWLLSAELGNAHAQYGLGNMYREGQGVIRDYQKAIGWYCIAIMQEFPSPEVDIARYAAMHNLAAMFAAGQGVAQDFIQAYKWFNFAVGDPILAYERGGGRNDGESRKMLDLVASKMTPAAINEARRLINDWTGPTRPCP